MMSPSVENYFASVAAVYSRKSDAWPWRWLRSREAKAVRFQLKTASSLGRTLDLGCGTGFYTRLLAAQGFSNLTALDASAEMLAQVDPQICVKVHAAAEEFFSAEPFDTVVCAGVIEFSERPDLLLSRIHQLLSSSGKLVLLFPLNGWLASAYRAFHRGHGISVHTFSLEHMRGMAYQSKLQLQSVKRVFPFSAVALFSVMPDDPHC